MIGLGWQKRERSLDSGVEADARNRYRLLYGLLLVIKHELNKCANLIGWKQYAKTACREGLRLSVLALINDFN